MSISRSSSNTFTVLTSFFFFVQTSGFDFFFTLFCRFYRVSKQSNWTKHTHSPCIYTCTLHIITYTENIRRNAIRKTKREKTNDLHPQKTTNNRTGKMKSWENGSIWIKKKKWKKNGAESKMRWIQQRKKNQRVINATRLVSVFYTSIVKECI